MSITIVETESFRRAMEQLMPRVQKTVRKKISILSENPRHRTLHAHRLRQANGENVWTCYISITKRLLYQFKDGKLYLWDVGEHGVIDSVGYRNFDSFKRNELRPLQ